MLFTAICVDMHMVHGKLSSINGVLNLAIFMYSRFSAYKFLAVIH